MTPTRAERAWIRSRSEAVMVPPEGSSIMAERAASAQGSAGDARIGASARPIPRRGDGEPLARRLRHREAPHPSPLAEPVERGEHALQEREVLVGARREVLRVPPQVE